MGQYRAHIESLEGRRLLSASETAIDLGLTDIDLKPGEHTAVLVPGAQVINDGSASELHPTVTQPTVSGSQSITLVETVGLPALVRTYSGTYSDPRNGVSANVRMTIRRQVDRGGYASLRGSFSAVIPGVGTIGGEITYGKARPAPNLHVDISAQGSFQGMSYTVTINGKASASGSQIKGNFTFTSSAGTSSGTVLVTKVVKK
jgi:hypothetical protein